MAKLTKKAKTLSALDSEKLYTVDEALKTIKELATAKFDETIEAVIKLGVDPKHSDQMVRGVVAMPNGTGKSIRIAVFARADKAEEARKAGADIVGAEELVDQIKAGKIDFDRCVATPDMMGLVGMVAKILGPKGMMPNPKLGTVTMNVADAIKSMKAGQVEFRAEKAGIVHAGFGKASFDSKSLRENLEKLIKAIIAAKPAAAKGTYLKAVFLSSTMGSSVRVDVQDLLSAN